MTYRLSIRVSEEARAGIDRALTRYGLNLTSLMEAWGLEEMEGAVDVPDRVLTRARKVETERRARR